MVFQRLSICQDWAAPSDRLGVGVDHRRRARHGLFVAAQHDGQLAALGPGLAAGDGGVDEPAADAARLLGRLARQPGGGGGVVDHDPAGGHGGQSSSLPTHSATSSQPCTASAIVAPATPPCSAAHRCAFSGERLNTATSWPARFRWPAIG
jgi:hypothetical protein